MFKVQFPTSFPRLTADVRRVVNRILLPLALRSTSSHGHMHLTLNVWEVWVQLFLPQVWALPYPQQFQSHLESQIGQFVGCRWIVQVFIVWQDFLPPSVANFRTALQVWLSLPVMSLCTLAIFQNPRGWSWLCIKMTSPTLMLFVVLVEHFWQYASLS